MLSKSAHRHRKVAVSPSYGDELLKELFAADTIIVAAGMINFGVPSNLKAYIDYIIRPGVTFRAPRKDPRDS
jgi:FMN-dependent NADH-azoreductase